MLGKVVSPFCVQFGKALELLLELPVVLGALFRLERAGFLFENRIRLELLLNDVLEFQSRSLQYMKALLQLWREHLLHRQILELMNPRTCHTKNLLSHQTLTLEERRPHWKRAHCRDTTLPR